MAKRIGIVVILVALIAPFAAAQVFGRGKAVPRQKPRLAAAVTVIDLRNVTAEKKPPKRLAEPVHSLRMMAGPATKRVMSALPPAQLSEALKVSGISVPPPDVYARFTPAQTQVPGKGYLFLTAPDWAFPDRAEFHSTYSGVAPWIWNGPMVVLKEPGTFVLDFLVEFPTLPAGTLMNGVVEIGYEWFQLQAFYTAGEPQHVLVVWNLDPATAGLGDEQKSIGLHCLRPDSGEGFTYWTFFLVDVTKL